MSIDMPNFWKLKSLASCLHSFKCLQPGGKKFCRTAKGLKQHQNSTHPDLSSDESDNEAQRNKTVAKTPADVGRVTSREQRAEEQRSDERRAVMQIQELYSQR
ncbi:hypothetical protein DFP72DRAFT_1060789 [Ephemerocybe angulata]|uniref:Uncharacterized protein n=1 Tax=Ephemerocybe angulata TaxID=980116 RepID=A0A8H6IE18_9AGAR|nr:hypothetical protein DFP72DRAFT_1060789 [Tulosesus angulatus]